MSNIVATETGQIAGTHDPGGKSKPRWPSDSRIEADFSLCGCYRYALKETWDENLPAVMFLLMNPSVAGMEHSDPTLRRTGAFARIWGYGTQFVGNVHAYRATDAKRLLAVDDPFGPGNRLALCGMAASSKLVVLAYGQPPGRLRAQADAVVTMLRGAGARLTYLRLSQNGTPCHPLYLPSDLVPLDFAA